MNCGPCARKVRESWGEPSEARRNWGHAQIVNAEAKRCAAIEGVLEEDLDEQRRRVRLRRLGL